jgi:hypothetical protein
MVIPLSPIVTFLFAVIGQPGQSCRRRPRRRRRCRGARPSQKSRRPDARTQRSAIRPAAEHGVRLGIKQSALVPVASNVAADKPLSPLSSFGSRAVSRAPGRTGGVPPGSMRSANGLVQRRPGAVARPM